MVVMKLPLEQLVTLQLQKGPFWETMNAAGVLQVPMVMSVWDDGYGISVPRKYQTTKDSISEALAGFKETTKSQVLKY